MESFDLTDLAWVAGMVVLVLGLRWAWEAYSERGEAAARAARRMRSVESRDSVPALGTIVREQHSDAAEQPRNSPGTAIGNRVPEDGNDLPAQLAGLDPDALLELLASIPGDGEDGYRWSPSAIGRFVGGRLQDRIDRVRELRGETDPVPEPAPPVRMLRLDGGRREIPWEETA